MVNDACFAVSKLSSDTSLTHSTTGSAVQLSASSVTTTSAILGGNVTSDGGASVTDRGVVWSTVSNPTINDNKASVGTGTGSFSSTINSLSQGTVTDYFWSFGDGTFAYTAKPSKTYTNPDFYEVTSVKFLYNSSAAGKGCRARSKIPNEKAIVSP